MSAYLSISRAETAQSSVPDRRVASRRRPSHYPSAFVAQVLSTRNFADNAPQLIVAPVNPALAAYRDGARVTERRMPAGYGWAESA